MELGERIKLSMIVNRNMHTDNLVWKPHDFHVSDFLTAGCIDAPFWIPSGCSKQICGEPWVQLIARHNA